MRHTLRHTYQCFSISHGCRRRLDRVVALDDHMIRDFMDAWDILAVLEVFHHLSNVLNGLLDGNDELVRTVGTHDVRHKGCVLQINKNKHCV